MATSKASKASSAARLTGMPSCSDETDWPMVSQAKNGRSTRRSTKALTHAEGGSSLGDSSATWRGIGKCPIRRPGICSSTPPFDSGTGYRMDADLIMRMLNSSRSPSSLREHKRRTKGRGASIKKVQKWYGAVPSAFPAPHDSAVQGDIAVIPRIHEHPNKEALTVNTITIARPIATMLLPIALAAQSPSASTSKPVIPPSSKLPFAFASFTWLNGNSRQDSSVFDSKYFTGEFRADISYIAQLNHPSDHTLVGT